MTNLGRLLIKKLEVRIVGRSVYSNNRERVFSVYHDLWKSDKQRAKMARFGLASTKARQIWSGNTANSPSEKETLLASNRKRLCTKLDKVFAGGGALYPYGIAEDIFFRVTLPDAKEIMDADSGSKATGFTLKDVNIRFESIICNQFDPSAYNQDDKGNNMAEDTHFEYQEEKQIFYDQPQVISKVWKGDSTAEVLSINDAIKMLDSVVILFTKEGSKDSEEFVNPNIERIDVTVEGKSNLVYERGILGMDLFREASRLFGSKYEMDSITEENFLKSKFAALSLN